jgi:hypothetical protein
MFRKKSLRNWSYGDIGLWVSVYMPLHTDRLYCGHIREGNVPLLFANRTEVGVQDKVIIFPRDVIS